MSIRKRLTSTGFAPDHDSLEPQDLVTSWRVTKIAWDSGLRAKAIPSVVVAVGSDPSGLNSLWPVRPVDATGQCPVRASPDSLPRASKMERRQVHRYLPFHCPTATSIAEGIALPSPGQEREGSFPTGLRRLGGVRGSPDSRNWRSDRRSGHSRTMPSLPRANRQSRASDQPPSRGWRTLPSSCGNPSSQCR